MLAAVAAMSACSFGQSSAVAYSTIDKPFGSYDASLSNAADVLLSPSSSASAAKSTRVEFDVSSPAAVVHSQLPAGGGGSAAARVELLRPLIEPILATHGVPVGMAAALMMVESGGRLDAVSNKGARGMWQLMPDTARRYGLRVDDALDERLDLLKSTAAAAQYLDDLYVRFGDWKLALAGYNAGEAVVSAAIMKANSQDFARLSDLRLLPLETRNYVPSVLGRAGFTATFVPVKSQPAPGKTVFAVAGQ
jgi:soluble lytic murein transglycosylase-like protein